MSDSTNNLESWLNYIDSIHFSEIDLGLSRIKEVAQRLDLLKPSAKVVTVAGTNGKGSTCAYLSALLGAANLNVGVYSSPHLIAFNERIRINNEYAKDDDICTTFKIIDAVRANISLTYFEFATLAALYLFKKANLDVIILEVGLGGRLDAVNIINADFAIITSIGFDHTKWLGEELSQIATEKLGILRTGIPLIYADDNQLAIVVQTSKNLNCQTYLKNRDFSFTEQNATYWRYQSKDLVINDIPNPNLLLNNAAIALQAAKLIHPLITAEQIKQGFSTAYISGRFEQISINYQHQQRHMILDVAHNPPAAKFLMTNLVKNHSAQKIHAVFSVLDDKDYAGIIDCLTPVIANWAIAQLDCSRGQNSTIIANHLRTLTHKVSEHLTVSDALIYQLNQTTNDDVILIFGSFYVVSAAKITLNNLQSHLNLVTKDYL